MHNHRCSFGIASASVLRTVDGRSPRSSVRVRRAVRKGLAAVETRIAFADNGTGPLIDCARSRVSR